MTWPRPVRLVGLGSPHGQDALGWRIVADLEQKLAPSPGIEFHRLGGAQDLLHLLDGKGTLIVVDAVASGQPPGTLHRLSWPTDRLEGVRAVSSHGVSLAETLKLAETLSALPPCVELHGVEIDPGATEECPEVVAACRRLTATLAERVALLE